MKSTVWSLIGLGACVVAHAQNVDWSKIDDTLGRKAAVTADVHRYGFPRSDLTVNLDGVTIKPALALGGWIAFKPLQGGNVMAMGDLVLLEHEISPVPASSSPQQAIDIDTAQLDQIIGGKGSVNGGVYQVGIARRDAISEAGMPISPPGPLGVATGINFQATGSGKAAVTGDFVLSSDEVNPVLQALRASGIEVTALHSHMLTEQPRLFFMHFWANDDAIKLAKGLRAALDKTARARD